MSLSMKWSGDSAFISGVGAQSKAVQKEVGGAIFESAQRVEKQAASIAPVDTGNLHDHIVASKVTDMVARVDSFAEYSGYVENGTRKMEAQPFLAPSMHAEAPRIKKIVENIVKYGVM